MATKAKRKPKRPSQTPVTPPQSVADVLLAECMSQIDRTVAADYAEGVFRGPDGMSEKKKRDFAKSVLLFASLGWTYYNATNNPNP
jgi:hypothetical protein